MKIKFDFEGREEYCAFFALYAGLRMYKEQKEKQVMESEEIGLFSIPAAEVFCMLQDLKQQHPKEYAEAVDEYNEVYGTNKTIPNK